MLNDLFRTYKKIIVLVVLILCAIIFWFYGCHRQQQTKGQTQTWEKTEMSESGGCGYHFQCDHLSGEVVFGTKGYLAKNKILPVQMTISSEEGDFTGTLKITLPGADGEGVSYQSAVYCRENQTSDISMEVPSLGNASYFYFEILDSFGSVVFSEKVSTTEGQETSDGGKEIYIGVLCSQYSSLEYLDGMELELDDHIFTLRLIHFLAGDFPTSLQEMGSLSGMIIDAFDTSTLSKAQIRCLTSWVAEGGSLFVGTGTGASVVLSGLDSLLKVQAGEVEEVYYSFSDALPSAGSARLYTASLDFTEDTWESLSFSSPECMYRKTYGDGKMTISACSLTDDTFCQWTGREDVIRQIFHEEMEAEISRSWVDEASLWYVKKTLYSFMNGRKLNTFYYGVFFIAYLGVLGFFAYYLLRKIKRREYIWGVVPAVAILFTISLAFRMEGSGGESGQNFSAIRINDSSVGDDAYYLLYQDNEGMEMRVDLVSSIKSVEPVDYNYRVQDAEEYTVRNIKENYTVNNTKNGFDIAFEESIPGTSYILKCSGSDAQTEDTSCFSADIQTAASYFEGKITNLSEWEFDKVMLIRGRQYVVLDGIKPGETAAVEEDTVRFWTEYEDSVEKDGEDSTAAGNLVEYLKQRYMLENDDPDTLLVIGITDENDFELLSDGKTIKNQITAFVNRFSLEKTDDSECVININEKLDTESGETSLRYNFLEKNETKAVYAFDTSKLVWGLFRNRDGFAGSIFAYNYDTQQMDLILGEEDEYMNCGELEPYVSDMNKMTLLFVLPEGSDSGEAPILSLLMKDVED